MKNWLFFGGGVLVGVVMTLLVTSYSANINSDNLSGVTNFEQPGQVIDESAVQVIQVIGNNAALVRGKKYRIGSRFDGHFYLLRHNDGKYYTDDEIIRKPSGKVFRQTGIYKYETNSGDNKTVAIIELK